MRLMGRFAVVRRAVRKIGRAQLGLAARAGRKRAPRGAVSGLLCAAALGNPPMPFIAIEEVIAAINERSRGTVLEGEERHCMTFRGARRIESSGMGAHTFDEAAAQEP